MTEFHTRTLDLLGIAPEISAEAVRQLDEVERRIRRPLPKSVREWYSLAPACDVLRKHSNCDHPIPISEFGIPLPNQRGGLEDLIARQLLVFRIENQGVCEWAVCLDGSDDPPVVIDIDTDFQEWHPLASSFAGHLYNCVWDYGCVLARAPLIQAQNVPLTETANTFLRERFNAGEASGWPANMQYRFCRDDQRILIWANEQQADWWLSADRIESLENLLRTIWHCDDLDRSLWSSDARGEQLIRQIRGSV